MSDSGPDNNTEPEDSTLDDLLAQLSDAYDRHEDAKHTLDQAAKRLNELEDEIAKRMAASGTEKLKHDRWTLSTKHTVSWKVPSSKKDDVIRLVKQGAPELVKESVNYMSLNGYLRKEEERLDLEKPEWWTELEPMLERVESLGLSMRKR